MPPPPKPRVFTNHHNWCGLESAQTARPAQCIQAFRAMARRAARRDEKPRHECLSMLRDFDSTCVYAVPLCAV